MILTTLYLDTTRADARRDLYAPYDMHRTLARCVADDARPLFRIERGMGRVQLLTEQHPSTIATLEDGYLVDHRSIAGYGADLVVGDRREFRLWASPTVQRSNRSAPKGRGKRCNIVGTPDQLEWLHRQAERGGFTVMDAAVRANYSIGGDPAQASHEVKQSIPHVGVEFEGLLCVDDPERFRQTLRQGIGRGKAFGFGLLLLDPP